MNRARLKAKKLARPLVCEERIACSSDKEPPAVKCRECETLQCVNCEEELHKEGDSFFHERTQLKSLAKEDKRQNQLGVDQNSKHSVTKSGANNLLTGTGCTAEKLTLNPPSQSNNNLLVRQQHNDDGIVVAVVVGEDNNISNKCLSPPSGANNICKKSVSDSSHSQSPTEPGLVSVKSPQQSSATAEVDSEEAIVVYTNDDGTTGVISSSGRISSSSEASELSSEEFHSLGLDSILDSELVDVDMKGQSSSKPSKKTKAAKKSCSTLIQEAADITNQSVPHDDTNNEFAIAQCSNGEIYREITDRLEDLPPSNFHVNDHDVEDDEELVSNLIRSVRSDPTQKHLETVASNNHPTSQSSRPSRLSSQKSGQGRSFLLIDESENIQVGNGPDLLRHLGCGDINVKVVSIFGNTGDGKSFTLNHVFFGGDEVFATSADQDTCTIGVWTAYDPNTKVMCIDTEGLLGVTSNQNKRTRLLLKILAVSDVIIYRTFADRLHTDLFQFLGDASQAYNKHFKVELEALKQQNGRRLVQDLGPAVIVFHETTRTNTLDMSGSGKSADEILKERFTALEVDMTSFSSIRYVGVRTTKPPTDFSTLIHSLKKEITNCSVRSPRSPVIVYDMLKILNSKFRGDIYSHSPNSFPEEFFTCGSKCLACTSRCVLSMNHRTNHRQSGECRYVHAYDNKSYICKKCLQKGRKNEVVPKTCSSEDGSIMGVAKYVLAGYILECRDCGIIYKSREHWYGNKDPTETAVQVEIKHMWPGQAAKPTATHNAAWKLLDGVKVVADTVSAYGSKPTKMLSDWVADQVAPSYWVPNNEVMDCHSCHREFDEQEKKHHCRGCGKGFCDECTQYLKPVPERGWGPAPVRVCEVCYNLPAGAVTAGAERKPGEANSLMPRQIVENVQSVLGAVASVAIDYPMEVIKDSARPSYWVPDHLIKECHECKAEFGPKLTIHHCRACGNGVCSDCSARKRQVPSKGWDTFVRVCETCYKKEGAL